MWAILLTIKAVSADVIKYVQSATEEESDNGGEFTTTEFAAYCADEVIQHHYYTMYSP
jgi:hypothetical protein